MYLSKGMDYRIAKSRNFIRQAKRIEKKVQLLCKYSVAINNLMYQVYTLVNKASKISNITETNSILMNTIFGLKMNESDPE